VAKSDWFVLEKHIKIVNIILTIGFLIYFVSYLSVVLKAKFCKARLFLIIVFKALVYMLLPFFYNNTNVFC
jgi:hypothetical protein